MLLYLAYYQRKDMVVPENVATGWVDCLNIITVRLNRFFYAGTQFFCNRRVDEQHAVLCRMQETMARALISVKSVTNLFEHPECVVFFICLIFNGEWQGAPQI